MTDKYSSFSELSRNRFEGTDYKICHQQRDTEIVFVAPHGGKIEPGTSEITKALAGEKFSYYSFEGTQLTNNCELHITSTNFDEPLCSELIKKSETVISIHGKAGNEGRVFLGGLNTSLKDRIRKALINTGFNASDETKTHLMARSINNICNKGVTRKGVQLELHKDLRIRLKNNPKQMSSFCNAILSTII